MIASILNSIKKNLGLDEGYTAFDDDVLMHINSAFNTLTDLGIGPPEGFMIEDESTEWDEFLGGDKRLNSVKTYVYLRARLLFDPPQTSYLIAAMEKQVEQLEWRLNVKREEETWVPPVVPVPEPISPTW